MSKYFPLRSCGAFIRKFYPTVCHARSISRIGSDHASLSLMERDVCACVCVCVSVHQENNTGSYCAFSSSSITVTGELEVWPTLPTRYSFGGIKCCCESRCAGTEIWAVKRNQYTIKLNQRKCALCITSATVVYATLRSIFHLEKKLKKKENWIPFFVKKKQKQKKVLCFAGELDSPLRFWSRFFPPFSKVLSGMDKWKLKIRKFLFLSVPWVAGVHLTGWWLQLVVFIITPGLCYDPQCTLTKLPPCLEKYLLQLLIF